MKTEKGLAKLKELIKADHKADVVTQQTGPISPTDKKKKYEVEGQVVEVAYSVWRKLRRPRKTEVFFNVINF